MKRLLLIAIVAFATGPAAASELGSAGLRALNTSGWSVDVVLGLRQWEGGTLKLPEPRGQPVTTKSSARAVYLGYYGGDDPLKKRKGGLAKALDAPIGADIRRALDATGENWKACDPANLPVYGYTQKVRKNKVMQIELVPLSARRAAVVRWYDEVFPDGVRALSREIMVLRK